MLSEANFEELADDQFLTALALGIAALQDSNDPQARAKSRAVHQGQLRIQLCHCLALVGAHGLLAVADSNIIICRPKFKILISRVGTSREIFFYAHPESFW